MNHLTIFSKVAEKMGRCSVTKKAPKNLGAASPVYGSIFQIDFWSASIEV
jgi:hypothetical protein